MNHSKPDDQLAPVTPIRVYPPFVRVDDEPPPTKADAYDDGDCGGSPASLRLWGWLILGVFAFWAFVAGFVANWLYGLVTR